MKKRIDYFPWAPVSLFVIIALGAVAGAIGVSVSDNPAPGVVIAWIVAALAVAAAVHQVWTAILDLPDYISPHGCAVWTAGSSGLPSMYEFNDACAHFIRKTEEMGGWQWTSKDVVAALDGCRVYFSHEKVGKKNDKAGIQIGKHIEVWYFAGFRGNAFYHELVHLMDEHMGWLPDFAHVDLKWRRVNEIKSSSIV